MKKIISVLIVVITLFSCSEKSENKSSNQDNIVNIKGIIKNNPPEMVFIQTYEKGKPSNQFASKIEPNGSFEIPLSNAKLDIVDIFVKGKNNLLTPLIIEPSNDEINLVFEDGNNISVNYTVEGSAPSKAILDFNTKVNEFISRKKSLDDQMRALSFNDDAKRKELINQFEQDRNQFLELRDKFIQDNSNSPALICVINQIDPNVELDLLKQVRDYLASSIPNTSHFYGLNQYIQNFENYQLEQDRLINLLKPGTDAPELNFPGVNGEMVSLNSLKGKTVLIDFWASWCRPCRMENPNVVKLYNKYHAKGFEIYSFSLDQKKDKWIQAIQQDGLTWSSHASDLQGWQTAAIPIYGFNSIPFTVLIDKNGKVIDKNLRGQELENKLKEIFNF